MMFSIVMANISYMKIGGDWKRGSGKRGTIENAQKENAGVENAARDDMGCPLPRFTRPRRSSPYSIHLLRLYNTPVVVHWIKLITKMSSWCIMLSIHPDRNFIIIVIVSVLPRATFPGNASNHPMYLGRISEVMWHCGWMCTFRWVVRCDHGRPREFLQTMAGLLAAHRLTLLKVTSSEASILTPCPKKSDHLVRICSNFQ